MTVDLLKNAGAAVREANDSKEVGFVVISGTGDFFTSGNDQSTS